MNEFAAGDVVEWTSQSAGRAKFKVGVVKRVIPPGHVPSEVNNPGRSRDHTSYLVRSGGRWYWPRVSLLGRATSEVAS